jgi:histidine phosphotransferase ChpT
MKIDLRVTELLSSRLCHELISPVGAVGNGLELLEEEEAGMAADALALSIKSVRRASALLQFYRIAYGAAGSTAAVGEGEARSLASGILEGGKITLSWSSSLPEAGMPQGMGKLILNMLLLAIEALPRGGELAVDLAASEEGGGQGAVATVTATGQDARLADEIRSALAVDADVEALTAKTVQGYFLIRLAEAFGGHVEISTPAPGSVRLRLALAAR